MNSFSVKYQNDPTRTEGGVVFQRNQEFLKFLVDI